MKSFVNNIRNNFKNFRYEYKLAMRKLINSEYDRSRYKYYTLYFLTITGAYFGGKAIIFNTHKNELKEFNTILTEYVSELIKDTSKSIISNDYTIYSEKNISSFLSHQIKINNLEKILISEIITNKEDIIKSVDAYLNENDINQLFNEIINCESYKIKDYENNKKDLLLQIKILFHSIYSECKVFILNHLNKPNSNEGKGISENDLTHISGDIISNLSKKLNQIEYNTKKDYNYKLFIPIKRKDMSSYEIYKKIIRLRPYSQILIQESELEFLTSTNHRLFYLIFKLSSMLSQDFSIKHQNDNYRQLILSLINNTTSLVNTDSHSKSIYSILNFYNEIRNNQRFNLFYIRDISSYPELLLKENNILNEFENNVNDILIKNFIISSIITKCIFKILYKNEKEEMLESFFIDLLYKESTSISIDTLFDEELKQNSLSNKMAVYDSLNNIFIKDIKNKEDLLSRNKDIDSSGLKYDFYNQNDRYKFNSKSLEMIFKTSKNLYVKE